MLGHGYITVYITVKIMPGSYKAPNLTLETDILACIQDYTHMHTHIQINVAQPVSIDASSLVTTQSARVTQTGLEEIKSILDYPPQSPTAHSLPAHY